MLLRVDHEHCVPHAIADEVCRMNLRFAASSSVASSRRRVWRIEHRAAAAAFEGDAAARADRRDPPAPAKPAYPKFPKKAVTDSYGDLKVVDDFRALEDAKDPAVLAWSDAENAFARKMLDGDPQRAAVASRVGALMGESSPSWDGLVQKKGNIFALERRPPKQQPYLIVLSTLASIDKERVLVDPNAMDANGGTSIGWFAPSPDGKKIAVALAKGGAERGDVHVFDVATGKEAKDVVAERKLRNLLYLIAGINLSFGFASFPFVYYKTAEIKYELARFKASGQIIPVQFTYYTSNRIRFTEHQIPFREVDIPNDKAVYMVSSSTKYIPPDPIPDIPKPWVLQIGERLEHRIHP